jgi:hypothetical protein
LLVGVSRCKGTKKRAWGREHFLPKWARKPFKIFQNAEKRGKRGGKKALVGFFPSGFRENPLQGSQNNHNFADVNKQQSEY